MILFAQFLLRLSFGLATGMAVTSSKEVSSGYFRNHLYVTLGLATLAALTTFTAGGAWWPALAAAVTSYAGAVAWLYEKPLAGKLLLWLVAGLSVAGLWMLPQEGEAGRGQTRSVVVDSEATSIDPPAAAGPAWLAPLLSWLQPVLSGLVLGLTMAAMLLGHWYLNSPGMALGPLRRLLVCSGAAVVIHAVLCGAGLAFAWPAAGQVSLGWLAMLVLRWSFGLVGVFVLLAMAWQTLKIPNTQSATGILYVAVIGTFTGELMGQLLSSGSALPL